MPSTTDKMQAFTADITNEHAWMETNSGAHFDLVSLPIDLYDIAHGLSKQCRWAGQCSDFYSVAEHSVAVSKLVPANMAMMGLMHDAQEAYLTDIPAPWKAFMPGYNMLEDLVWKAVAKHFDLPEELPPEVKVADWRALFIEAEAMMPSKGMTFPDLMGQRGARRPFEPEIQNLNPPEAFQLFIDRYNELAV